MATFLFQHKRTKKLVQKRRSERRNMNMNFTVTCVGIDL